MLIAGNRVNLTLWPPVRLMTAGDINVRGGVIHRLRDSRPEPILHDDVMPGKMAHDKMCCYHLAVLHQEHHEDTNAKNGGHIHGTMENCVSQGVNTKKHATGINVDNGTLHANNLGMNIHTSCSVEAHSNHIEVVSGNSVLIIDAIHPNSA